MAPPNLNVVGSPRNYESFIEGFLGWTEGIMSPRLFRQWTAVYAVSGALERKAWLRINKSVLYPNMFILLIAPPGTGKTEAIKRIETLWNEIPNIKIAPSSVSRASLVDAVLRAERVILRPAHPSEPFIKFNALSVLADEFGTFLAGYEGEFMSTLNTLFDNKKYREEKRGMKDPLIIEKPMLNLLAGTTPTWLGSNLPISAWSEGFASRLMLVFSAERVRVNPFAEEEIDYVTEGKLVADLGRINGLYGEFKLTEEVRKAYLAWYHSDFHPAPSHPKLEDYLPRRGIHFLKMCMAFSAARSDDLIIDIGDYQEAQDLLLETEKFMSDVFKSMKTGADANVIDEAFNFIWQAFAKEQKPIPDHRIIHFLSMKIPSHSVTKVLEVMETSNMIRVVSVLANGRKTYQPVPRAAQGQ